MRLLINEEVVRETVEFSREWACRSVEIEDFKITIPLAHMSIIFFQPERYSQLIACYFDFGDDIVFFFEDVSSAIEGAQTKSDMRSGRSIRFDDPLERNDNYVRFVLDFCEKNIDLLTSLPPPWFARATEISVTAIRKNFPEIADLDLQKKQALLDSWKMHGE